MNEEASDKEQSSSSLGINNSRKENKEAEEEAKNAGVTNLPSSTTPVFNPNDPRPMEDPITPLCKRGFDLAGGTFYNPEQFNMGLGDTKKE